MSIRIKEYRFSEKNFLLFSEDDDLEDELDADDGSDISDSENDEEQHHPVIQTDDVIKLR